MNRINVLMTGSLKEEDLCFYYTQRSYSWGGGQLHISSAHHNIVICSDAFGSEWGKMCQAIFWILHIFGNTLL